LGGHRRALLGETSKTIIVPTIDDAAAEHNETFVVELSNLAGGATIADGTGEALILDPTTHQSADVPTDLKDAKNAARPGVTTSAIELTGSGKVFDLNVELDITHAYDGQLTVTLFAPNGTPVELFSNVGGSGDNFTATVLDDEAATSITAGSAHCGSGFGLPADDAGVRPAYPFLRVAAVMASAIVQKPRAKASQRGRAYERLMGPILDRPR
jgi:hypothetical protein